MKVEQPPPVEQRIAVGGRFLDEVQISLGKNGALGFPVERHRGVIAADGTATVYTMMPSALQLFAEGCLPRVGGAPLELAIGGRDGSRPRGHGAALALHVRSARAVATLRLRSVLAG